MKKSRFVISFSLLICIISSGNLSAQAVMQDVIYLKNGSIYKGTIIEQVPGAGYKIEITGGSVIVVLAKDVEKVTKEEKTSDTGANDGYTPDYYDRHRHRPRPDIIYGYKDKGYFMQIQFNVQYAGGGVRMINGYKINQYGMLGVGIGFGGISCGANGPTSIAGYAYPYSGAYFPFFIYYSGDILKKNITPFYAAEIGYAIASPLFPFGGSDYYYGTVSNFKGGVMASAGFGARFYIRSRFLFSLSANLDIQQAHTEIYSYQGSYAPATHTHDSTLMLLPAFKVGIGFIKQKKKYPLSYQTYCTITVPFIPG